MNGMTKVVSLFLVGVSAVLSSQAESKRMSQNHVPETLNGIREFHPEAAKRSHIALVNVGEAVPEDLWRLATTYAASRLQLNVWTNAIAASVTDRLVKEPKSVAKILGNEHAMVGVFFEHREGGCDVLAAPGAWCVINVAAIEADKPDMQTLRDRMAKLVLRGLARVAGGGTTLEPFCSMFYGAQSLQGLDRTNIMLAPICYFPMLEILRGIGGNEMVSPALPDSVQ